MRKNLSYQTEEGHLLTDEDFIDNVKWKVIDLINQGYSDDYILNFDDCEGWYDYAKNHLGYLANQKNKDNSIYNERDNDYHRLRMANKTHR